MKYTVVWTPSAEEDLAAIWIGAPDRRAVTTASNAIDALLRTRPQTCGEPRFDTLRILVLPPLGVDFDVVEADRIVYVLTVWHTGPTTKP